jgi:hypothetical protein
MQASASKVDLVKVGLASLKSVRAGASELLSRGKPFDVIMANAGVMACAQGKTADGFETQFGPITRHMIEVRACGLFRQRSGTR